MASVVQKNRTVEVTQHVEAAGLFHSLLIIKVAPPYINYGDAVDSA